GKFAEAEKVLLDALAAQKTAVQPDDVQMVLSLCKIGQLYVRWRKHDKAEVYYLDALKIMNAAGGGRSQIAATAYNDLGLIYRELKRFDDAGKAFDRALAIYREQKSVAPDEFATTIDNI